MLVYADADADADADASGAATPAALVQANCSHWSYRAEIGLTRLSSTDRAGQPGLREKTKETDQEAGMADGYAAAPADAARPHRLAARAKHSRDAAAPRVKTRAASVNY